MLYCLGTGCETELHQQSHPQPKQAEKLILQREEQHSESTRRTYYLFKKKKGDIKGAMRKHRI